MARTGCMLATVRAEKRETDEAARCDCAAVAQPVLLLSRQWPASKRRACMTQAAEQGIVRRGRPS